MYAKLSLIEIKSDWSECGPNFIFYFASSHYLPSSHCNGSFHPCENVMSQGKEVIETVELLG